MSAINCNELAERASFQLQNEFEITALGEDCLVVTPFLNIDAAPVEVYIQERNGALILSDYGEALNQLFVNGMTVEGNQSLLDQITLVADLHNIQFVDSELFVEVKANQLGYAIKNLANVIQATSYLLYKKSHRVKPKFEDKVEAFLIAHKIQYDTRLQIRGQANHHTIPLFVNSGWNVLIEPLSATTSASARRKAKAIAYQWIDLQRSFADKYKYAVVIDNSSPQKQKVWEDEEAINPLLTYSTNVLAWKEREALLQLLQ